MKILVCGGRDYENFIKVDQVLERYKDAYVHLTIIQGGAKGADRLAKDWAHMNYVPCWEFPAKWRWYGKVAGSRRNQEMLEYGQPDIVIAFPGGIGTADMVRRAKAANVHVIEIKDDKLPQEAVR